MSGMLEAVGVCYDGRDWLTYYVSCDGRMLIGRGLPGAPVRLQPAGAYGDVWRARLEAQRAARTHQRAVASERQRQSFWPRPRRWSSEQLRPLDVSQRQLAEGPPTQMLLGFFAAPSLG